MVYIMGHIAVSAIMPQYGVVLANSNDVINSSCTFCISSLSFFDKFVHVSMPYVIDGIITVSKI